MAGLHCAGAARNTPGYKGAGCDQDRWWVDPHLHCTPPCLLVSCSSPHLDRPSPPSPPCIITDKGHIENIKDLERVMREMHVLKNLQHPNIIKMHEAIEKVGPCYEASCRTRTCPQSACSPTSLPRSSLHNQPGTIPLTVWLWMLIQPRGLILCRRFTNRASASTWYWTMRKGGSCMTTL
jgi:hypothetical protein